MSTRPRQKIESKKPGFIPADRLSALPDSLPKSDISKDHETQNDPAAVKKQHSGDHDIDALFDEWIERREKSPNSQLSPETLWPELPASIMKEVKRRIEDVSNLAPFIFNESSSDEIDETIDLSVLKKGYRPIPGKSWELVEQLDDGNSGFGVVWKVRNTKTNRLAVFKFSKRPLHHMSVQTLHNEPHLLKAIEHPGIVRLLDESLNSAIPFLEYEYVEGVDFSKLLKQRFADGNGLSIDEAAAVMLKIVEIVAVVHSQPKAIVHRDLKPQNILVANHQSLELLEALGVDPDFRLARFMIMDFGIGAHSARGRSVESLERSLGPKFDGTGTEVYASPQQSSGEEACESDDVYALGVIWYELLAGQLGKGPPTGAAWRRRITEQGFTAYQMEILDACLEKERADRIPNAVELAKRIKEAFPNAASSPSFADVFRRTTQGAERLDLSRLTSLSAEAAELLANSNVYDFKLNGLETLSVEAAQALASVDVLSIELNGLTTISTDVAEPFVRCECLDIHLNGLKSISAEVADVIKKWKSECCYLNGLRTLPADVAERLATSESQGVYLDGLTALSADTAHALSTWKNFDELSLNGLTMLAPKTAEALAKCKCDELYLNGLTTLSTEAAEALAKWKGDHLYLNGLTALSDATAESLTKCRFSLTLNGLTMLSVEAAVALAKRTCDELSLDGLTAISVEVAEALAKCTCDELSLDGLTAISGESAEALAKWNGFSLLLNGLSTLSIEAATALAKWNGSWLVLTRITVLSEHAAEVLGRANAEKVVLGLREKKPNR